MMSSVCFAKSLAPRFLGAFDLQRLAEDDGDAAERFGISPSRRRTPARRSRPISRPAMRPPIAPQSHRCDYASLRERYPPRPRSEHVEGALDRRNVAAGAVDRVGAQGGNRRPEDRDREQFALRHIAQRARRSRPRAGGIEIRHVVARDDQGTRERNVLGPDHAQPPTRLEEQADRSPAEAVESGVHAAPTSAAIRSTTSSTLSRLESMTVAPAAGRSGATARLSSRRSRSPI